jgi:multisubunit Na+/H+ antiporter MnhB subunit
MTRLTHGVAWLLGAIAVVVGCWYVVVYSLDDYDRGYGRDTWFQLQLYLAVISVGVGLIGYLVAGFIQPRPATGFVVALVAGAAFAGCHLLYTLVMRHVAPDRDTVMLQFAGALVIGALSTFVEKTR